MSSICPLCGRDFDTAGHCACENPGYTLWLPPIVPMGWKCPQCGRIHAPHISTCPFCQPYQSYTWYTSWESGTYTMSHSCSTGEQIS
jgi:hypothetical protein